MTAAGRGGRAAASGMNAAGATSAIVFSAAATTFAFAAPATGPTPVRRLAQWSVPLSAPPSNRKRRAGESLPGARALAEALAYGAVNPVGVTRSMTVARTPERDWTFPARVEAGPSAPACTTERLQRTWKEPLMSLLPL